MYPQFFDFHFLKLARMRRRQQVTGEKLVALGRWLLTPNHYAAEGGLTFAERDDSIL